MKITFDTFFDAFSRARERTNEHYGVSSYVRWPGGEEPLRVWNRFKIEELEKLGFTKDQAFEIVRYDIRQGFRRTGMWTLLHLWSWVEKKFLKTKR